MPPFKKKLFFFFFIPAFHSDEAMTNLGVSMQTEVRSLNVAIIIQCLTFVHTLLTPRVQLGLSVPPVLLTGSLYSGSYWFRSLYSGSYWLGLFTVVLTDSLQWVLLMEFLYSGSYWLGLFTVGLTDRVSLQWVLLIGSLYSGFYWWSLFTVGLTDWVSLHWVLLIGSLGSFYLRSLT